MTHLTQSLSFISEYTYSIVKWAEEIYNEYKKSRDTSNTMKELSILSDKQLRDIGLTRGEIYDVAHRTHYGERS